MPELPVNPAEPYGTSATTLVSQPAGVGDSQTRYLAEEVRRLRAEDAEIRNWVVAIGLPWEDHQSVCYNVRTALGVLKTESARLRELVRECAELLWRNPWSAANDALRRKCREVLGEKELAAKLLAEAEKLAD